MKAMKGIGIAVLAVAFYVGWRGGYVPVGSVTEAEKSAVKTPVQMLPDIDLVDTYLAAPVIKTESPEVTRKNPVRRALTQADQELKKGGSAP